MNPYSLFNFDVPNAFFSDNYNPARLIIPYGELDPSLVDLAPNTTIIPYGLLDPTLVF